MRQIELLSSKAEKQLAFWDYNGFAHFSSVILLFSRQTNIKVPHDKGAVLKELVFY